MRPPVKAVLLLLGASLLVCGGWYGHREYRVRDAMRSAQSLAARYEYDAACDAVQPAVATAPERPNVRHLAASLHRRAGKYDDAEAHLKACRAAGGDPALEEMLLRVQRGDLIAEAALLARLDRDETDAVLILEALARACVETQRLAEAQHCVGLILARQTEHAPALAWHGLIMEQLHRRADAADSYRHALVVRPSDEWTRLSLGDLLLAMNRPDEALEHFEVLRRARPDNAAVQLGLAQCYRGVGRLVDARALLDRLVVLHPSESLIQSERGLLALDEDGPAEAEPFLRQAVALRPSNRQAIVALAQCYRQLGRPEEAAFYVERTEQLDADGKKLLELRKEIARKRYAPEERAEAGVLCLRLGKEEEGLRWLKSALADDPNQPKAREALRNHMVGLRMTR